MSHGVVATEKKHEQDDEAGMDFENDSVMIQDNAIPPDGGWGWFVVFASFMIHIITDGVSYSFGVFFVEFVNYFNAGNGETAWIISILVGTTYCSGPIASILVNKYGCRAVTIAGSILACVSLMVSVFAKSIFTLYFTIGLGTGFGLGLIYLPAIVSVTMYFEKLRALATGIAVCGSGFGTFLVAPLLSWLIEQFQWKGAILIVGASMLVNIIFGIMFRPLEYPPEDLNENELVTICETKLEVVQPLNKVKISSNPALNNIASQPANGKILERPQSMVGHYTMPRTNQRSSPLLQEGHGKHNSQTNGMNVRLALSQPLLNTNFGNSVTVLNTRKSLGVMSRPDILYQGSLANLPQYSKAELRELSSTKLHGTDNMRKSNQLVYSKDTEPSFWSDTKETCKEMLDCSLFSDPVFILFAVSNFCTSIGFNVPYIYIIPQALRLNISQDQSSYLISIIGIANTVGRIILGFISDKKWVDRLFVYNTMLLISGIATFFCAFCNSFLTLAICMSVFGFTIGAYVGLTSVILVDLLGLKKLTNAFGILLLFQGLATFIGSPLAGFMFDVLESYTPGFFLAGAAISFSGLILFAIRPMQRYRAKRLLKQKAANM